jgi:hypothetical protein
MSKVDALRAMREARYEANRAKRPAAGAGAAIGPAPTAARAKISAKAVPRVEPAQLDPAAAAQAAEDEPAAVCGHRSIGNKSCQRPAGHAEKNHRYK